MAKKLKSLSIFFPAYNDEHTIGCLVKKSFEILPKFTNNYELIVVNDGSFDQTERVLNRLSKKYPKLKIVNHRVNRGYGAALISGIKAAKLDFIFYTDGDGQYDVGELPKLIDKMEKDISLVNGCKIERNDSLLRIFLGKIYAFWVRIMLGINFTDVDCDFRLFRAKSIKGVSLTRNSGAICAEILLNIQKKGKIVSIPVHHYPRKYGKSQFFRFNRILKTILDDFWLWRHFK